MRRDQDSSLPAAAAAAIEPSHKTQTTRRGIKRVDRCKTCVIKAKNKKRKGHVTLCNNNFPAAL